MKTLACLHSFSYHSQEGGGCPGTVQSRQHLGLPGKAAKMLRRALISHTKPEQKNTAARKQEE